MTDDAVPIRDERGRLLPGAKLEGAGRKPGTSQADLVRKLIEPHRESLIDRAIDIALKDPDSHAAARALELVLSRLAPTPRQEAEKVQVEGLAEATTFAGKCDAIITAVANGDISAEAGERVLKLLDIYRKAHETDDLAKRIAALEIGKHGVVIEARPPGSDLI